MYKSQYHTLQFNPVVLKCWNNVRLVWPNRKKEKRNYRETSDVSVFLYPRQVIMYFAAEFVFNQTANGLLWRQKLKFLLLSVVYTWECLASIKGCPKYINKKTRPTRIMLVAIVSRRFSVACQSCCRTVTGVTILIHFTADLFKNSSWITCIINFNITFLPCIRVHPSFQAKKNRSNQKSKYRRPTDQ